MEEKPSNTPPVSSPSAAVLGSPREASGSSPSYANKKEELARRRLLTKDHLGDGNLVIRPFADGDSEGVQQICFDHFRSSCLAAVRYYIAAHFQDLAFLTFVGFWFVTVTHLLVIITSFNLYLFVKSRIEMDKYIRHDCSDLRDVKGTYMSADKTCRFWVAEVQRQGGSPKLAGCVGLVPSRENPHVAKLVRLMVEGSHRRMRIGSRLLLQLEDHARENGYDSVRIYTNTLNPSHMKFVRQHGYTIVQTIRRGLMRGDLVTWHKTLMQTSEDLNEENTDEESGDVVKFRIRSAAQHVMD